MYFEQIPIDGDKNFAYLIADINTSHAIVVDPGCDPGRVMKSVKAHNFTVKLILATHSHYDHIAGVDVIRRSTKAPFAAYKTVPDTDQPIQDGQIITLDSISIRAVFCPGHCADSLLFVINNEKVLVGDELFIGGVGITRSEQQAKLHHHNLHNILMKLDEHLEVYPGHDYGQKPYSTIAEQRTTNPYLLQPTFEDFWHLRQNWKDYCAQHSINWG